MLGHEGAGEIVAIGEGVTGFAGFAIGEHVISSFVSMRGKCRYCQTGHPQLCDQAAKADHATPHIDNAVKIDAAAPLDKAALIGCGVMAGVGAAANTAKIEAGSASSSPRPTASRKRRRPSPIWLRGATRAA